jgi:two-component system CheB/CheR fusion protein
MIIVVFSDVPVVIKHDTENMKTGKHKGTLKQKELEIELRRSYEDLQSAHEEMQTSQEELKSTNEELQSSNEELKSTNEELTTSKEEMQSLNEELQTVNIELQSKITDYVQANNDMKNLLNSTEIATLFLDKDLNIRRFTDNLTEIIKIRSSDINRPFTDLVSNLQYSEMENHARQVLKTLIAIETTISTHDERWYKIRIMPYRTYDDRIDGIVMTFTDVTMSKQVETALAVSEARFLNLFENAKDGIFIINQESGKITEANLSMVELLGYSLLNYVGKHFWEIGVFKDIASDKESFFKLWQNRSVRLENIPLKKSGGDSIIVEFTGNVYSADKHKLIQCMIREKNKG